MSYKNSNLYASKVFAEHPVGLWAIDEDVNFVSLISETEKEISEDFGEWTLHNFSEADYYTIPATLPVENSEIYTKIFRSGSASYSASAVIVNEINYAEKIDAAKNSICFNAYVYIPSETAIVEARIGFIINGQEYYQAYTAFAKDTWSKFEYTKDLSTADNISPYIQIEYNGFSNYGENDSSVYISGVSVGQWSEPFNSYDTGVQLEELPSGIVSILGLSSSAVKCVSLDQYGFNNQDYGYAICKDNSLLIETTGIPMVYGARSNVSLLAQESAVPSLIFPGKGFLNESGKYSNLTTEFWIRINNESINEIKIFGPLSSDDGIYIKSEFITVKVGKYVKSYYISQWYRTMLVHFGQTFDEIYLLINGEKVISIPIDSLDIPSFTPDNENYLAFFGHMKALPIEVSSFAIYPYIITEQIAKRRFVYGQGVQSQEAVISSLGGDLTYVEFPYSGYSSTIAYPDRTPWSNGYSNNLNVSSNGLSLPNFSLPEISFKNIGNEISQGESELIWANFEEDNFDIQDEVYPFIMMAPKIDYENTTSTIYFSNINKTGSQTKSIYSVLKTSNSDIDSYQPIMYFSNKINTNNFEIAIQSGSLQYLYNGETLFQQETDLDTQIVVGFDIEKITQNYPQLSGFFSNTDNISLNFAGVNDNTFFGKIFSLTINNKFFTELRQDLFDNNGFALGVIDSYTYIGAYTLLPKQSNLSVYLDVAASGYWESSIPLTYFGKYINLDNGEKQYDLDLIQFNIDIPNTLYSRETEDSSEYNDAASIKTYISLQHKDNVGLVPFINYINTVKIGNTRLLDFDEQTGFYTTKFEVNDSTVIFPPKDGVDFNDYYITTHILMTSEGINTENMTLTTMSLSSMASDESAFYKIGTATGRSIYPITRVAGEYAYKSKNPVTINHESGSYLYVSGDSGISVLPEYDSASVINGISFPINESLKSDFKMVGLQMYLMFNEYDHFSEERIIGKFYDESKEYLIYLTPESDQKRAEIKFINSATNEKLLGSRYFLNGLEVSRIIVKPFKWNSIVVSLQNNSQFVEVPEDIYDNNLIFYRDNGDVTEGISGQLELYSGLRVDNVAIFSDINEIKINQTVSNDWTDIAYDSWELSASVTWAGVLNERIIPITVLSINAEDVYETYFGLSKIVADDNDLLTTSFDSIKILNDAEWTTFEYKPI